MIHARNDAPVLLNDRHSMTLTCPNESFLIPWRMASFVFHCTALLAVADYRRILVFRSLPLVHSPSDYDLMSSTADLAVAVTVVCLAVCLTGMATAMSLREEVMNLIHAVCHTVGGVLLVAVWFYTSHVARLWHVWYFFSLAPASVELMLILLKTRHGLEKW